MDAKTNPPTDEQVAILTEAKASEANMMLQAYAGTGKTSTLEAVDRVLPKRPSLYLVFNKANAEEAKGKMLSTTTVKTFNSCGHGVWAASQSRNLRLDSKKVGNLLAEMIKESPKKLQSEMWECYHDVVAGVNLAKALGYVPEAWKSPTRRLLDAATFHRHLEERPDDLTSDLIDAVLIRSIRSAYDGLIDFNDQIYMPALFGGTFSKFPTVLVDEYQDLSPVNHALLERLVKGRIIGVGDRFQNIYGFRGAKAGGMDVAVGHYSMQTLPLSISFRCPSAIVSHVHWRVPAFRAFREGGFVETPAHLPADAIRDDTTIICRNNAPIFACALKLLGAGRGVTIVGSDIGARLVGILRKLGPDSLTQAQVLSAIDEWLEVRLEREAKNAKDTADCMRIFASKGANLSQAIAYAEHVLKQTGSIRLLTGHKSKGLEFDEVIHLDPWLVRRNPTEQDRNLDYVISTRSRDRLIEIDSEGIQW